MCANAVTVSHGNATNMVIRIYELMPIAGLSNQSFFVLHTQVSHRPYVIEYRIVSSGTESCVC